MHAGQSGGVAKGGAGARALGPLTRPAFSPPFARRDQTRCVTSASTARGEAGGGAVWRKSARAPPIPRASIDSTPRLTLSLFFQLARHARGSHRSLPRAVRHAPACTWRATPSCLCRARPMRIKKRCALGELASRAPRVWVRGDERVRERKREARAESAAGKWRRKNKNESVERGTPVGLAKTRPLSLIRPAILRGFLLAKNSRESAHTHTLTHSWPQSAMTIFLVVAPLCVPNDSTFCTTSRPLVTSPNTTCLPSSHSVMEVVRKNWLPLVPGGGGGKGFVRLDHNQIFTPAANAVAFPKETHPAPRWPWTAGRSCRA